jgi:hypothetical protein
MDKLFEPLKPIKPGKTYPSYVKVTEKDGTTVEFHCNSFYVGMYCAIHLNGSSQPAVQTGDHNNKKFCTKLKQDLKKAYQRGATVEIGAIRDCQLTMPKQNGVDNCTVSVTISLV